MKIEISKENIKNVIDELRIDEDDNYTVNKILQVREDLEELFSKCSKGVHDYNNVKVWAEFGRNLKENHQLKGSVVQLHILNGKFYLVDAFGVERWRANRTILLELHDKPYEVSEYLLEDYRRNSVEVRGNVVTFSLKRKRLVFDYELGRYEDFTKILDYYLSHIPKQVLEGVKQEAYSLYKDYFPNKM
jgi:hypothetical protein